MKADDEGSTPAANTRTGRATTTTTTTPENKGSGGMSNCFSSAGFCCFKFKEQTQISALEFKIANRQKKFGVDYMNLVEQKASQAALKECLKEAMRDITALQTQVNEHYDSIDQKKQEVDKTKDEPATRAAPATSQPKKKPTRPSNNSEDSKSNPEDTAKKASTGKTNNGKKKKKTTAGDKPDGRFTIDDE